MQVEFSIITVTFNAKKELLKTIKSIQSQSYKKFIHIIKDGESTDRTNEIDFLNLDNTEFYSSKDNGVYDAMNQATKYAKNEFIIYLNAGDFFYSNNTLKKLSKKIKDNPDYFSYCGGTMCIDPSTKKINRIIGLGNLYKYLPLSQLPHPSFVIRKSVLIDFKYPFDPNLKIASDYKQQLILRKNNLWKVYFIKQVISIMPEGGISTESKTSIIQGYLETFKTSFRLFNIISLYVILLKILLNFYSKFYVLRFRNLKEYC